MVIKYQNTVDEYAEASKALAERKQKKIRGKARIYFAIIFAFIFAACWFYETIGHADDFVVMFNLVGPIVFIFGVIVAVSFIAALIVGRLRRPKLRQALGLVFLVSTFLLFFFAYRTSRVTNPPSFVWNWMMLMPHTTWMFLVVLLIVASIRNQQTKVKRMWDEQPSFHRAKTADISAEGVVVSDAVSRNEMHWDSFVGWEETKTLFVLFLSEHMVVCFPKQAFASDEQREAMRALARFIPKSATASFPVIQSDATPSAPPPLPAEDTETSR